MALKVALALILDSPDQMYLVWGDQRTFFFNEAYFPVLGPRLEQAMGARFEELWHDAWPAIASAFARAEAGEHTRFTDMPVPMARFGVQEETWWTFSYSPVRNEIGDVAGVLCVTVETTEQIMAAQKNEAREHRNQQILDSATDFAIMATRLDGKVSSWSKGAENIMGWTEAEMCNSVVDRIFTPEDREAQRPLYEMKQALEVGHGNDERWHLKKSGERFWAQGEMTPLRSKSGEVIGFVKVLRDRTVERLRELRLDLIAQASARLLTSVDPEEVIDTVLKADAGTLGFDQSHTFLVTDDQEHMRLTHTIGIADDVKAGLQHAPLSDPLCGIVVSTRQPLVLTDIQSTQDDRYASARDKGLAAYAGFPIEVREEVVGVISFGSLTEVAFDTEALAFFATLARFLSIGRERFEIERELRELTSTLELRVEERTQELMKTEDALRQSQKVEAIGQLTGGVAHDFNNLLTVIKGSVDLLRRDNLPEAKRERYINAISDTADRAVKLTGQLLAFARRQALKPEVFDVGENIEKLLGMIESLSGPQIEVSFSRGSQPCLVHADSSQFDTALVNMTVNARDSISGQGRIMIKAQAVDEMPAVRSHPATPGKYVAVSIADTGSGIDPEQIDLIFEPFFTTKGVGKGTGLGLSQVFGFVKQSGGNVFASNGDNTGAVFTLYLPQAIEPAGIAPEPVEVSKEVSSACILVVEDNDEVGQFAVQALQELGHRTVLVTDAASALTELQRGADRFDLVFSDVLMPGMSGIELGEEIRRLYRDMPVVLTSGYSSVLAKDSNHGFELLHKPYSIKQLSQVVHKTAR